MLQCSECELCQRGSDGELIFLCDPFSNIKEPECLIKWQLLRLDTLIQQHERLQQVYDRLAPMQEKLFNYMEREIEEQEDTESWKQSLDEDDEEDNAI